MKRIALLWLGILMTFSASAQVDNIASKGFSVVKNGTTLSIPYESSHDIAAVDPEIKYLVFSIHGANRNAVDYYDRMITARGIAGQDGDSTLVIAPQFLTEDDIDAYALSNDYLYWSSGGWIAGSNSRDENSNPRPERIPSYEILDSLILRTIEEIPSIEYVTLVGHSAGGQVVQRYAASSPVAEMDAITQRIRFIVANPSSYVYLDNKRRVSGSVDLFEVPTTSCSDYNEWKYGLDDLFTYPSRQGATNIRTNYKNSEVIYLLGGDDDDPSSSSLDMDCAAQLQGAHRLERGTIFFNYLNDYYGELVHQLDTVPNVGHSSTDMFASEKGVFHIFKVLGSEQISTSTRSSIPEIGSLEVSPNPFTGRLYIISPSSNSKNVNYRIYDITGKLHLQFTDASDLQTLDMSTLPSGVYFIHASLGTKTYQEKILKL